MGCFIPVKYGRCTYPDGINPRLVETAGHFDSKPVQTDQPFSLHTEYSFTRRKFSSASVACLSAIRAAHTASVPQLWRSPAWASEFVDFVCATCNGHTPTVIEIHPPFDDYADLPYFLECYGIFEQGILRQFPDVTLLIENRSGTTYHGGAFILSTAEQLTAFSNLLDQSTLRLKITLDIPQLFTAHGATKHDIVALMDSMRRIRHNISGIHLWGKRLGPSGRRIAHNGDLDSYFFNSQSTKALFLQEMSKLLDDDIPRFFVPEVNSGQTDFLSILNDLLSAGFVFL